MLRTGLVAALSALFLTVCPTRGERAAPNEVRQLQEEFARQAGARLVFHASELPPGRYHDIMPSLAPGRRAAAARLALREVQKLPPGYLGSVGLKAVGVFAACASRDGDGFRRFDEELKGYRYYGIWNGEDAVAAAFYDERQLGLTLQHEIFHHVDGTTKGRTDAARARHDERFADALSGKAPYPALRLAPEDLAALRRAGGGHTLEGAVSDYCRKSPLEDKAETARYLMSHLADALVQAATRPQLPGSQRLLHVLHKYEQAPTANGPSAAWFVDRALGRKPAAPPVAQPAPVVKEPAAPAEVVARLLQLAVAPRVDEEEARDALRQAAALKKEAVAADDAAAAVRAAARLSDALLREMIRPADSDRSFRVRGGEDARGVNPALRRDLAEVGELAKRLRQMAALAPSAEEAVTGAQLRSLRLLARYHRFIAGRWRVTGGTRQAFEEARDAVVASLPAEQAAALRASTRLDWDRLADRITPAGALAGPATPREVPAGPENPYLSRVDAVIADPLVRSNIRRVQPACVRLSNGSGVNLAPEGIILTASHCVSGPGARINLRFPDGRAFTATCVAFDAHLDLAVCTIADARGLPFAPLAAAAPQVGTWVAAIGQPGSRTPKGEPTGYRPFHVSTGHIRGLLDNPLGSQRLGRALHDAWTYWGHSGCPLFNRDGGIVALHNSWDSTTAMRRAVPYEAIVYFLRREKVPFTLAQ
jgi:S1-C subfamily serine protease